MRIITEIDQELTTEEAAILSAYLHETAHQSCRELTQANQTAVGKGIGPSCERSGSQLRADSEQTGAERLHPLSEKGRVLLSEPSVVSVTVTIEKKNL